MDGYEIVSTTRAWCTNDEDSQMSCYATMKGRITVAELIDYFTEHHSRVDPMGVRLNFATANWTEPPTDADIAERERVRAWREERTERWERETYARLWAKYGTEVPD